MKKIRRNVFETNSSSTHALSLGNNVEEYLPKGKTLLIEFMDTDDYHFLDTLKEKVSYLVSHIVRDYMWNSANYEDLIEQVEDDYNFKRIYNYVYETYGKEIKFPTKYNGSIEEIVSINHQLINNNFDDLLRDIVNENNYLEQILSSGSRIILDRD